MPSVRPHAYNGTTNTNATTATGHVDDEDNGDATTKARG
jgi:hypothetical protein